MSRFHGSVKTFAHWVWHSSKIGELCVPLERSFDKLFLKGLSKWAYLPTFSHHFFQETQPFVVLESQQPPGGWQHITILHTKIHDIHSTGSIASVMPQISTDSRKTTVLWPASGHLWRAFGITFSSNFWQVAVASLESWCMGTCAVTENARSVPKYSRVHKKAKNKMWWQLVEIIPPGCQFLLSTYTHPPKRNVPLDVNRKHW